MIRHKLRTSVVLSALLPFLATGTAFAQDCGDCDDNGVPEFDRNSVFRRRGRAPDKSTVSGGSVR